MAYRAGVLLHPKRLPHPCAGDEANLGGSLQGSHAASQVLSDQLQPCHQRGELWWDGRKDHWSVKPGQGRRATLL